MPIAKDYVDDALRLAAEHLGEPWLSPVQRRESWLGELIGRARLDTTLPPLLTFRLRATWQVGRLDAGVPVKTLVRAAGLKTAASLSPLLQFTTSDDDTALAITAPTGDARGPR